MSEKGPKPWISEPAESFGVEFNNSKHLEVTSAMSRLGFTFERSQAGNNGRTITYIGRRTDGTTMTVIFEQGADYKSPKALAEEKEHKDKLAV